MLVLWLWHQHRSLFTMAVMLEHFCFSSYIRPHLCMSYSCRVVVLVSHADEGYCPWSSHLLPNCNHQWKRQTKGMWMLTTLSTVLLSISAWLAVWGSESILEVTFRSFMTGKGWKMVSCDIIHGSGNTKLLCWDSSTGGSLTGLRICTTTRAVLCRKSWHGHHGACWWL